MIPSRHKNHLDTLNDRYREALDQIGSLLGGDPRRPDWDPTDAVGLAVDWVRTGKVDTDRCLQRPAVHQHHEGTACTVPPISSAD